MGISYEEKSEARKKGQLMSWAERILRLYNILPVIEIGVNTEELVHLLEKLSKQGERIFLGVSTFKGRLDWIMLGDHREGDRKLIDKYRDVSSLSKVSNNTASCPKWFPYDPEISPFNSKYYVSLMIENYGKDDPEWKSRIDDALSEYVDKKTNYRIKALERRIEEIEKRLNQLEDKT